MRIFSYKRSKTCAYTNVSANYFGTDMRRFSKREDEIIKKIVNNDETLFKDLFDGLFRNQVLIDLKNGEVKIQHFSADFDQTKKRKVFSEISTVTYLIKLLVSEGQVILWSDQYNFNKTSVIIGDRTELDRGNFIFNDPKLVELLLKYADYKISPTEELRNYVKWFCITRDTRYSLLKFIGGLISISLALYLGLKSLDSDKEIRPMLLDSSQYKLLLDRLDKFDTIITIDKKMDSIIIELKKKRVKK